MKTWPLFPFIVAACSPEPRDSDEPVDTGTEVAEVCGAEAPTGLEVGDCTPEFALPDRYGETFTLSSMRGKVALVDISAVW